VLSATGSSEISGASLWLDAVLVPGEGPTTAAASTASTATVMAPAARILAFIPTLLVVMTPLIRAVG